MKSKKWKVIRIKNPQLRRLRKNLRTVLKLAVSDELKRLDLLWDFYFDRFSVLTPSQIKRKDSLRTMGKDLSSASSDSILNCSYGTGCVSKREGRNILGEDMGWVPLVGNWVCAKCHDHYHGTKEIRMMLKREFDDFKAREEIASKPFNHSDC